ncbi:MAG: dihydroorotate dehydrogenase electron transfer subunit [Desulfonatronovibrionaceae bacterium]
MPQPQCIFTAVKDISPHGSKDFFSLYLKNPGWDYAPGQFVMLRPESWGLDPLWPRPFSICQSTGRGLRIFFRIAGRGTRLLSGAAPGDIMRIWGPLGNGFDYSPGQKILILAGGMGLAPFLGLMSSHPRPGDIRLIFGYTAEQANYPLEEIPERLGQKTFFRQKTAKDLEQFQKIVQDGIGAASDRLILACGPQPFLRFIRKRCLETGREAQISLENTMACGVGACLGCVQKDTRDEYVSTCKNGPVFPVKDIRI